ncbi:MAG: sulfite exporter TauE/SafE family protein [Methanomicrobiales archaeon]
MNFGITNFYILILILTGLGVGFATGLLGLGGGFILGPVQFWLLESLGYDSTIAIRVAFGTSLAVILPTAISGAYGHYRRKSVIFKPALILGISGFIGGLFGGVIATNIPGEYLRLIFGFLLIGVSAQMLIYKKEASNKKKENNLYKYIIWGLIAGTLSGLLGIGGGVVLVPILILIMGFTVIEAIGTSTAVIVLTSIGGIISYIVNGWGVDGLPPYSLGYVNLLQMIILILFTVPMAQLGLRTAHKLPDKYLKIIFVCIILYMALRMIGVFKWLNIPL